MNNVSVLENDVLLNITGDSIARACKVPHKFLPARVNQHVAIIRPNEKLDCNFLLYYLQFIKPHLLSISEIGGTRKALTKGMLEDLDISLPDPIMQNVVASILSSLDDKIDLLHRQNSTLEKIAETLFRQWFLEKSHKEWEEVILGKFIVCQNGISYRSQDLSTSEIAMINLKNFGRDGQFRQDGLKEYSGKFKPEHVVQEGDVIVAHTDITQNADIIGNPIMVNSNSRYKTLIISMDIVKVLLKNDYLSQEFLYFLMKTAKFKEHCKGLANGSTVLHLNKQAVPSFSFPLPPESMIKEFSDKIKPVIEKQTQNLEQIQTLTTLRDTLLPRLMSGEIRVAT